MVATHAYPTPEPDQRVVIRASWDVYEKLLEERGEASVPRMTYLEGLLEIMSPSIHLEGSKKCLARLLEAWAEELGVPCEGYGSWTLKSKDQGRGAEPDECYVLGDAPKDTLAAPDIAIEVIWSSGGIDKLEVYRRLGVREVWMLRDGKLRFHALRQDAYVELLRSELLPSLDPRLLERALEEPTQTAAVRWLRSQLRNPLPAP